MSLAARMSPAALLLAACAPSVEVSTRGLPDEGAALQPGPDRPAPAPIGPLGLTSPAVTRLESGLFVVAPARTSELPFAATAQVVLTVPGGAMDGQPGVADLVANAVADNEEHTPARPSLHSTLAGLGATLSIRVGAHTTTFAVEAPSARWRDALTALSAAMPDFPASPGQFERIRERTLARLSAQVRHDPVEFVIEQLLAGTREDAHARIDGISDRDLDEARAHHDRYYRPTGAVVGVVVPGLPGPRALAAAKSITEHWIGEPRAAEPLARTASLPAGIYWSPGEPPSRVAIVIAQPDPWDARAAGVRLLQECTTMSGLGGRLELALDRAGDTGFLFTNRALVREGRRHLVLECTLQPEQIPALWQILQEVRASYTAAPPSDAELQLADRRASLIAIGDQSNPRLWLETATWQVLRGRQPEAPADFLARLADPRAVDLGAAAAELQGWPLALVVIGGRPDQQGDLPIVRIRELERSPASIATVDRSFELAAAEPWLRSAIEAVGGPERLQDLGGYTAVSTTTPETGPAMDDRIWVASDGLRRERQVLSTTVETVVTEQGGYEVSGGERRELAESERRRILRNAHSHPLHLLASCARGETRFRYVSRRTVGDRQTVVLEAVDPAFARLRIHVEASSGLVRRVETWRAGFPSYAVEIWSDYRSVDGLRVPFHRVTELDNASHGYRTDWHEFRPGRPPDAMLGRQR